MHNPESPCVRRPWVVILASLVLLVGCGRSGEPISKGRLLDEFRESNPPPTDCVNATDPGAIINWLSANSSVFSFGMASATYSWGACTTADGGSFGPIRAAPEPKTVPKQESFSFMVSTFGTAPVAPVKDHWMAIYNEREWVDGGSQRAADIRDGLAGFGFESVDVLCQHIYDWCEVYVVRGDVLVAIDIATDVEVAYPAGAWNDAVFMFVSEIDKALRSQE